jgi:methionyl-tRNA formyltransferase
MEQKEKIKIVFFGAGAFAVPVLDDLLREEDLEIRGIYTQIDKIAGRKGKLTPAPLGQYCLERAIPFERVPSVNEEGFLRQMRALSPDLAVIVSFGQILKKDLLDLPRHGCLNVHSSLLPAYRGASPIATAILNGEKVTGVTFMQMDEGLDTGGIYEQHSMEIGADVTTPELENSLATLAGEKLGECIRKVCSGHLQARAQDHTLATLSRKIRKHHGSMDWTLDAGTLVNRIRAYYPWPSVTFILPGEKRNLLVKITGAAEGENAVGAEPGNILEISRKGIRVACGQGSLLLQRVIPEGKKEMDGSAFANGAHLTEGMLLLNGPEATK